MTSKRLEELKQTCDDLGLPALLPRPWCQIKAPAADDQIVRVMQWNVLAQGQQNRGASVLVFQARFRHD